MTNGSNYSGEPLSKEVKCLPKCGPQIRISGYEDQEIFPVGDSAAHYSVRIMKIWLVRPNLMTAEHCFFFQLLLFKN